ncbi:hypothetical protein WDW86_06525 [Bdellovibrionota bacterium FG-2]
MIRKEFSPEDVAKLIAEVERLRGQVQNYNVSITQKIDTIESDMENLIEENSRLVGVKEGLSVERDACIALMARLARTNGINTGVTTNNTVVIDLPAGQVNWQFSADETHLIETLPTYERTIEDISIEEKYNRVMNPGI